ncbi:hypothetical protein [Thiomonas delicata]|uniref:Uncharacterized protein n=1 Tax=Thiomonas delicata TaxID=364030 RepID=A0A238DAC0_THIDL|nr:hypothetical protein [Thiomonas delicata]SBP90102.1 conserved exported hypothetical protein [Thiomonas delicata]
MRKASALVAAAAAFMPALALAAQPLLIQVGGHAVPMHETVKVVQGPNGAMKVSTWQWQSPQGHERIVIQRSEGGAPPAWAIRQMRDLQLQMQGMQHLQQVMARMSEQALLPLQTLQTLAIQPPWAMPPLLPAMVIVAPQQIAPTQPATTAHRAAPPLPRKPAVKV